MKSPGNPDLIMRSIVRGISTMDLKEQLNRLMLLQSTEDDIAQIEKDKASLQLDIDKQKETVEELEKAYAGVHEEKLANQKKGDALEVKIQSKKEENEKLRIQLNTTKNQKDYDAILSAVLGNEADMSKWEDEELEALETVDELKEREAQLQAKIAEEKNTLEEIKQRVAESREEYNQRIEKLSVKQKSLREQIGSELLSKFDQISNSKNKRALAKVEKRICGGCFTKVPKQIENQLMRWDKPVHCHSCGRLLMLGESSLSHD